MLIRKATPADIPALFEIRSSVRENRMSRAELAALGITRATLADMLAGDGRGWVAEASGQVLAFAMANAAQATVFALFVHPDHEGRGLGRRLMAEAERWLFACGCAEIWLVTDSNREVRANGFYRRLGWLEGGMEEDGQVRFIKRQPAVGLCAGR
nr:GNAT family N-acetyltransferase [Azoarcus sp. TTM-91]